jgi:hypothetical protein
MIFIVTGIGKEEEDGNKAGMTLWTFAWYMYRKKPIPILHCLHCSIPLDVFL